MKPTFFRIVAASALAASICAGAAFAQECPADPAALPTATGSAPEDRAQLSQMYKLYRQSTQDLRVKLDAAMIELDALSNTPSPDPKRIEFLAGEIARMRAELGQKSSEFRDSVQKKFGAAGPAPEGAPHGIFGRRGPRGPQGPADAKPAPDGADPRQQQGFRHHRGPRHGGWAPCYPCGGWMMGDYVEGDDL